MDEAKLIAEQVPTDVRKARRPLTAFFLRLVREKPLGTFGAISVLLLFAAGISADLIAPHGFNEIYVAPPLTAPSPEVPLGSDNLGRDLLSRIIYGARVSMVVGLSSMTISVGISCLIGIICGFLGGKTDIVMQRFVDAWMCFPGLFIVLSIMSLLGPGMMQLIITLGVMYGIGGSRIVRSAVMGIKNNIYVEASRSIGCSTARTLLVHILPNVAAPIIIMFTTGMGGVILAEATLSFLGFGIPPPTPSWGGMLNQGRPFMINGPWLAIWPGVALTIVVYGINMFGDALRDLLDPRLRGGLGRYTFRKSKTEKKATA